MAKTNNIDVVERLTNLVKRYTKHYKTDFIEYDLPKLLKSEPATNYIFIARDCGTWLVTLENEKAQNESGKSILAYYTTDDTAQYYRVTVKSNVDGVVNGDVKKVDKMKYAA